MENHWIPVYVCQDKVDFLNGLFGLSGNDVHIWFARLDQPLICVEKFAQILSTEELAKASNFHFVRDKDRFIVSHGLLRTILANYINIEPKQLSFSYTINGKPYLTTKFSTDDDLIFNMSHSYNVALYTIVLNRRIGVDLEFIRDIKNIDQITEFFFSKSDKMMINMLPEKQKKEAFFNIWTRKEAYIKAIGGSLLTDLDKPIGLLHAEEKRHNTSDWFFQTLSPVSDYIATVAVDGYNLQFKYFQIILLINKP